MNNLSKSKQIKSLRDERKKLSNEIKTIMANYKSLPSKEAKREAAKKIFELRLKRKELSSQLKQLINNQQPT